MAISATADDAGLTPFGRDRTMMRVLIVTMPVVATFVTFVASADWFVWVLPVVLFGAIQCARDGESNVGLGVIVILTLHWLAAVEDRASPWTLVVALAIATFHTAMAASGVAAPDARWSTPMRVRWVRRLAVVMVTTIMAWALEMLLADADLVGSAVVLATALAVLTLAAVTLRARALRSSWR